MKTERANLMSQLLTQSKSSNKHKHVPKEYMQVAEGMETQFANHMIQQMEKSINRSKPLNSAEDYYNSLLNYERAKKLATTGDGIGIKDVILDQIYYRHNQRPANYKNIEIYKKQSASKEK